MNKRFIRHTLGREKNQFRREFSTLALLSATVNKLRTALKVFPGPRLDIG
jgi:hypothetical protein